MRLQFYPDNHLSANLGIENNNPGNIRFRSDITWQGQIGQNAGFVVFSSMAYGYRALIKNLQTIIKDGHNTIRKIITEWAPPTDGNDTQSYIQHVSERTQINADTVIPVNNLPALAQIAAAISQSEIGTQFPDAIQQAVLMLQGQSAGITGSVVPQTPQTPQSGMTTQKKVVVALVLTGLALGAIYLHNQHHDNE